MSRTHTAGGGTPRVSIGMPVFNGERYLATAVESVLAQTLGDLELIIADNASTDGTEDLCRQYAARDPRVRYRRFERNAGAAANYNRVFAMARGTYFKWAAHDDVCEPTFVERCVGAFEQAPPSVVLVYPRTRFVDAQGTVLREDRDSFETRSSRPHARVRDTLRTLNYANAVFGLMRTDALRHTRLIDTFVAADYVLLVELALLGQLWELPEPLLQRRVHAGSSRAANVTPREVAAWFDPAAATRRILLSPRARLLVEYLRSAHRMPLSTVDRCLCYATIPSTFAARRARVVGGRYKGRLRERLGRAVLPRAAGASERAVRP